MGGAVGLKGTDGQPILQHAMELGAKPIATKRAEIFLEALVTAKSYLNLIVGADEMGAKQAEEFGYIIQVVGKAKKTTSAADTQRVAKAIVDAGADLLVYCGGDGTTRDLIKIVDMKIPVLGVPTGVKMHSALFAVSPRAAASVAINFLWGNLPLTEAEVMDVDEKAFRQGHLSAELYGYMLSPYEPHLIQGNKMASPSTETEVQNQAAIALSIIDEMNPNIVYIIGPGTTTRTISDLLDQKKTLLGVDIFQNKILIAKDVNENQILKEIEGKEVRIVVTPIGGQGFIFGRGNQQISAKIINQVGIDKIIVIATKGKLERLDCLRVDTGDPKLDGEFRTKGVEVFFDYKRKRKMSVE